MTLDGKILRELFEHETLKPTIIRTNQGNIQNLAELKQIMNANKNLAKTYKLYIKTVDSLWDLIGNMK